MSQLSESSHFEENTEEGVTATPPHSAGQVIAVGAGIMNLEVNVDGKDKNYQIAGFEEAIEGQTATTKIETSIIEEEDQQPKQQQSSSEEIDGFPQQQQSGIDEEDIQGVLGEEFQLHSLSTLQEECRKLMVLWDNLNSSYSKSQTSLYFLLSMKWLETWKKHVSYDRIAKSLQPDWSHFAKYTHELANANDDLILADINSPEYYSTYYTIKNDEDGVSILLKENLRETIDYVIVDRDIVDFFKSRYSNFNLIPRRASKTSTGNKITQVYYPKVNVVILNYNLLKHIDQKGASELHSKKIQIFSGETQGALRLFLVPIVKDHQFKNESNTFDAMTPIKISTIRLWKFGENDNLQNFFQTLRTLTNTFTSYDYKLKIKIPYIQSDDDETTVEKLGLTDGSTLVVEVQAKQSWFFKIEGQENEEQCEFCRSFKILKFTCKCNQVRYCSPECKRKDMDYHSRVCEKATQESDEENDAPYVIRADSVKGICGLSNLGNTCFMNSALQCLSNTVLLTDYFLTKRFKKDINETNVLGTKGDLARKYALFLKNIWIGQSRFFSPYALKAAISQYQSMFQGFQQHDSQEFLSFILDGLHEDLNRVKIKQNTESIDSNGRDDHVVSRLSWENYLKRNQSIVIDLMTGQFKSLVSCPDCDLKSVTFDPFLACSLPIPNPQIKTVQAYLIFSGNSKVSIEVTYQYLSQTKQKIKQMLEYCSKTYAIPMERLKMFSLSFSDINVEYDQNTSIKELKRKQKYGAKNTVILQLEEQSSEQTENQPQQCLLVQFIKPFKDTSFAYSSTTLKPFTFVRPLYLPEGTNMKQVHLSVFNYVLAIFERESSDKESQFFVDKNTLTISELYEKYILKAETQVYSLLADSDASEYLQKQCSWCAGLKCKGCVLPFSEKSQTLRDVVNKSKLASLKVKVIVNVQTELGKMLQTLHSLNTNDSQNGGAMQKAAVESEDDSVTLEDCLKLFEIPEKLGEDNEWYCPRCKMHKRAEKQLQIYRAPEILILHLKRFKGTSGIFKSKLNKVVKFPLTGLDLTKYVVEEETPSKFYEQEEVAKREQGEQQSQGQQNEKDAATTNEAIVRDPLLQNSLPEQISTENINSTNHAVSQPLLYDLYAVTNHYGNLGFGHYTAYAKNNGNNWFCFDDSTVTSVNEDQIVSEASYILFYQKRRATGNENPSNNLPAENQNNEQL